MLGEQTNGVSRVLLNGIHREDLRAVVFRRVGGIHRVPSSRRGVRGRVKRNGFIRGRIYFVYHLLDLGILRNVRIALKERSLIF